jgi:hypothetical protein
MDGSVQYEGTSIVLQVSRDSANSVGNELKSKVDHMDLNYDMIILLQHILYLYYIHDNYVE